jgi:STAS-like domain of unknown function (DUF4325)/Uncharacterized protein conserved in bacteria (DUF2188)
MVRIEVKRQLGSDIVTREHGKKLRELVTREWQVEPVIVDFAGLQVNSVSFFDEAFGQLALHYGEKELRQKIRFEGLDKFDQALVRDVIGSRSREARKRAMSPRQLFVERRPGGDYAVRKPESEKASTVLPTEAEAIERAREMIRGKASVVERVRHTTGGNPDKWRKP